MRRKISQSEARRLKKRVDELEKFIARRDQSYAYDYPGGVNFLTLVPNEDLSKGKLEAATRLRHHIVAKWNGERLHLYGVEAWRAP